ncbi:hypothetical protein GCM10009817_27620 [Terrabacter lapilli]|uniref:PH (Pleckstrin Homology) domain-containing protein n=1 Tax=Terrabacter lapilli TaxID=436231 RepID=A0ABN2SEF0_9MICO
MVVRSRRRALFQALLAALVTAVIASAVGLPSGLVLALAGIALGASVRFAPPQQVWLSEDSLVVEGWRQRRTVRLADIDSLSIQGVRIDPPLLEIIYARTKAVGPIYLRDSSKAFLDDFVTALEGHGRADDRYIHDNLVSVRRFLGR